MQFKNIPSNPELESSNKYEITTPNIWDKRLSNDTQIILLHFVNDNHLHIRLIFSNFSRDNTKHLTRFFDCLYQLYFSLDLSKDNIEEEIIKLLPIVKDLIEKFTPEYNKLSVDYDFLDLRTVDTLTIAQMIIDNFNFSSDVTN